MPIANASPDIEFHPLIIGMFIVLAFVLVLFSVYTVLRYKKRYAFLAALPRT